VFIDDISQVGKVQEKCIGVNFSLEKFDVEFCSKQNVEEIPMRTPCRGTTE